MTENRIRIPNSTVKEHKDRDHQREKNSCPRVGLWPEDRAGTEGCQPSYGSEELPQRKVMGWKKKKVTGDR